MAAQSRKYSDLDLDFKTHPVTSDVTKIFNDEAVRRSVRHLLLLGEYEKPFHPEIGSRVLGLLFEPLTPMTASLIRNAINETINNNEPRVTILFLQVTPVFDDNGFRVFLQVQIENQIEPVNIELFLEKLR